MQRGIRRNVVVALLMTGVVVCMVVPLTYYYGYTSAPPMLPASSGPLSALLNEEKFVFPTRDRRNVQDQDSIDFMRELYALQFPSNFSFATHRTLSYSFGGETWPVGTGWVFENMVAALTYAYSTQRTLIIAKDDKWYLARDACSLQSYECFLKPITNITQYQKDDSFLHRAMAQQAMGNEMHIHFDSYPGTPNYVGDENARNARANCKTCHLMRSDNDQIPWRFRARGRMWLKSHFLRALMHPQPWLQALVDKQLAEFEKTPEGVIAMHIRHGDKTNGPHREAPYKGMIEYMTLANTMQAKHGVKQIFISTDDPEMLSTKSLNNFGNFIFHFDPEEYRLPIGSAVLMNEKKEFNRTLEGMNALKNILIMGECDYMIGTASSFFTRQAFRLQFANGKMRDWATADKDPWANFPYEDAP